MKKLVDKYLTVSRILVEKSSALRPVVVRKVETDSTYEYWRGRINFLLDRPYRVSLSWFIGLFGLLSLGWLRLPFPVSIAFFSLSLFMVFRTPTWETYYRPLTWKRAARNLFQVLVALFIIGLIGSTLGLMP